MMSIPSTILGSNGCCKFGATTPHHKDLGYVNLFDQCVDAFHFGFNFVAFRVGNNTTAFSRVVDFSEQSKYIIINHFNNKIIYKES